MNEAKLVTRLRKKNPEALEKIIQMYTPYVSTVIRSALRGCVTREDLEELTADTFVALWDHAENIESDRLSGYLAKTAKSKAYNYMRKNTITTESLEDMVITSDTDVESETEKRELQALLLGLINEASDKERNVLLRFYYYRQTITEIAADMFISVSAVKTGLSRGRKRLRTMLEERGYGYEEMDSL